MQHFVCLHVLLPGKAQKVEAPAWKESHELPGPELADPASSLNAIYSQTPEFGTPNLPATSHAHSPTNPDPKAMDAFDRKGPHGYFFGSTFPGIFDFMLFHDAAAADLSAPARGSRWEAHRH